MKKKQMSVDTYHYNIPFFMNIKQSQCLYHDTIDTNDKDEKDENLESTHNSNMKNLPFIITPRLCNIKHSKNKLTEIINNEQYLLTEAKKKKKDEVFIGPVVDHLMLNKVKIINRHTLSDIIYKGDDDYCLTSPSNWHNKLISIDGKIRDSMFGTTMTPYRIRLKKSFIKNQYYDIFYSSKYDNLIYEESKIFYRKEHNRKIIIESIKKMLYENDNESNTLNSMDNSTKNSKNILADATYLKTFYKIKKNPFVISNNSNLELLIKSINITFIDLESNESKFTYDLPFKYIPLFYYKGIHYFQILLSKIITFSSSFDNISIILNQCFPILKSEPEFSNKIFHLNTDKPRFNTSSLLSSKDSDFFSTEVKFNKRTKIFKIKNKDNDEINDIIIPSENIKEINISQNPKVNTNEINDDIYELSWITPTTNYKIIIYLPKIIFTIPNWNIAINKFIDYDLLFYLYENKFNNWDFYTINYLLSHKKFRGIIDMYLSHCQKIMILQNKSINLVNEKIYTYSYNECSLPYISTGNDCQNSIKEIKGITLKVTLLKFSDYKNYSDYLYDYFISLNLEQTKKLIIGSKIFSNKILKDFLLKFMDINGRNLTFNYDKFDLINSDEWEKTLKDIKYFSKDKKFNKNNNKLSNMDLPINKNILEFNDGANFVRKCFIEIMEPTINWIGVNDNGKIVSEFYVGVMDIVMKIINSELNKWADVIEKYLELEGKKKIENERKGIEKKSSIKVKKLMSEIKTTTNK